MSPRFLGRKAARLWRRPCGPRGSNGIGPLARLFKMTIWATGGDTLRTSSLGSTSRLAGAFWLVVIALSIVAIPGVLLMLKAPRVCGLVLLASGCGLLVPALLGIGGVAFPALYLVLPASLALVGGVIAVSYGQGRHNANAHRLA
jgi:hypothetical protein